MYREEIYKMLKTLQGEHIFKKKIRSTDRVVPESVCFMQETWSLHGFVLVRKEQLGDEDGAHTLCTFFGHQDFLYFLF